MSRFLLWIALLAVPTTIAADARLDELKSYGEPLLAVAMGMLVDDHHSHQCASPEKASILGQNEYGWIYISVRCADGESFMLQSVSDKATPTIFECGYWDEYLSGGGNPKCWQPLSEVAADSP